MWRSCASPAWQPGAHFVPLGSHLDDWIGSGRFRAQRSPRLGYPPIPFTREPVLIAAASYVNAVVDLELGSSRTSHFLLSGVPRGGFSGGGRALPLGIRARVVTQSLLNQVGPAELGYFAATSIEAVWECLARSKMMPESKNAGLGRIVGPKCRITQSRSRL
jgi:hypothetical protein